MLAPQPAESAVSPLTFRRSLLLVVVLAAAVRLFGIDFDQGHFYHPDERAIADATLRITFVPLQLNPHFFPYGSFPFYVTRLATVPFAAVKPWFRTYDGVLYTGRFLSALWGAAAVWLTVLFGRRLYGETAGLLAGFLLAVSVLHLQYSHFAANDVPLTFLVLLALFLLGRFADGGRARDVAFGALTIGLAIATKASAAPLLLPLAVALLLRFRADRNTGRLLKLGVLAGALVALGFFVGEPYAVLDSKAFLHDVTEQSHMVRHAGDVPYTNQYNGTSKGFYELKEMVLWGLGPFLGLAALWGTFRKGRRPGALAPAEWVAMSWVVPFFLISASFEVKFPRYMLPIYPLLALWAAAGLVALPGRRGWFLRRAVAFGTALYALAFMAIYARPHTIVTASEWFYAHVPEGKRVLIQGWDEGFPFTFPGLPASRYTVVDYNYYEPDDAAKMAALSRELARADYAVFQTKRIYGAVTRSESKFPLTNDFFRAMFAGDLGYVLIKDVTSRPGLFGITLPDELADESFSVYDHPKALIFENRSRLSSDEIEKRIRSALPSKPVTRNDMLLARAGATADAAPEPEEGSSLIRSSLGATILLAGLVELLGLAAFSILARLSPPRPGLYAFSKVAGVLVFAYVPWIVASLGWAPLGRPLLLGVALLLVIVGWRSRSAGWSVDARERRITERVFWGTFLFFLAVRAFSPEVYWGERPMDFAFLNTLYRTSHLPPPEPWCAGTTLSYTYFGHYAVAALGRTLAIHPGLMFNLGIALFAALTAAAVLAAGSALHGIRTGLRAVFLALFTANLSGVRELLHRRTLNFDYFWATSRVVPATVNEYPLWSFVFADLHAHVLAMPFSLGFVAVLLFRLTRDRTSATPRRDAAVFVVLAGLFFGAITVTSGWSLPTYASLLLALLFVVWVTGPKPPGFVGFFSSLFTDVAAPAAGVTALGALLYRPFWTHFAPPPRNFGLEVGPWARPSEFLEFWGLFLLLLFPFFFATWRQILRGEAGALSPLRKSAVALVAVLIGISLLRLSPPWGEALSVRNFTFCLFVLGLALTLARATPRDARLPIALATFAFAVMTGCEIVFVWDRMNTLFKYYLDSWYLCALAGAYVLDVFRPAEPPAPDALRPSRLWKTAVGVALAVCLFTSVTGVIGFLTMNRVNGPRGTLDGTAYLKTFAPGERAAYEWLNRNVSGIPVLCEAYGPAYQDFSRVTMNTGLPIVIGWDYHVLQRGHGRAEIERRISDVRTIYTSPDKAAVEAALQRYRVALVYVGPLERSTYAGANLTRFGDWPDLLTPLYRNPDVSIFAVRGNYKASSPVTAIGRVEELPEIATTDGTAAPAPPQDEPGKVKQPRQVAFDAKGNVFVCDFVNSRIQKLNGTLGPLLAWGRRGSAPGEFKDPCSVALGPGDVVYVADTWNSRIQVFDTQGKYLREWNSNFFGPRGVAVDRNGKVYVADTGNGRVVRFAADGTKELEIGRKGDGPGQLFEPNGLAVDRNGRIWVCDNGNSRVASFDKDGKYVSEFSVMGWKRAVFSEPNIAVDARGNLWLTVPLEHEVRAFTPDGRFLRSIKSSPGHVFDKPVGIAIAPDGRILVSDIENRLVWVGTTK